MSHVSMPVRGLGYSTCSMGTVSSKTCPTVMVTSSISWEMMVIGLSNTGKASASPPVVVSTALEAWAQSGDLGLGSIGSVGGDVGDSVSQATQGTVM